ncbi:MAG: hypothetical protein V4673_14205 [Pseudomonadota bacterium]
MSRISSFALAVSLTSGLVIANVAYADKRQQYEDAARSAVNREGCKSIPEFMGDLRGPCVDAGRTLHEYCDGSRGPVSCGSELADQRSRIFIARSKGESTSSQEADFKNNVNRIIGTIDQCIAHREAQMNVYSTLIERMQREDDPTLRPAARDIAYKQLDEIKGHKQQIENRRTSRRTCDELLRGI